MRLLSSLFEKAFTKTEHSSSYSPLSYTSCTHLVYPHPQFLLGITLVPREIEDNGYAKFWEVTKVCGLSENGE